MVLYGRNLCFFDFWNFVELDVIFDDENDVLKVYVCYYLKVMENGIFIFDFLFIIYFFLCIMI